MLMPAPHAAQHEENIPRYLSTGTHILGIGCEIGGRHGWALLSLQ